VISLHRSGLSLVQPSGLISEIGAEPALGRNINIPLPNNDFDNSSLFYAFQHVVLPVATEFQPTLVMVTTAFDASCGEELGTIRVFPEVYAHMTYLLRTLAGGKLAICLDCDNSIASITPAVHAVSSILLGQSPPRLDTPLLPTRSGIKVVAEIIKILLPHWECFGYFNAISFE